MVTPSASAHLPDEGIDRKQLRTALSRFRAVNEARLQRVRDMLAERHRVFVDLLPLLLHANHPTLPGYISASTPCGISGYAPDTMTLELAKRLSRSFNWQRPAVSEAGIHAVYMMGSSGTIGHSDSSDIDVWICYPEHLDGPSLALLQRKANLLQDWARGLELEAHLFLMNGEKFQRGQREPLTGENCGTAQHYLLLDEFYRTGILLAGRVPAWWMVPPAREPAHANFAEQLLRKRFMGNIELVDFGGIDQIPPGEFVGAGIWQLYKAIGSPYKSVLKLLLFEVYAANLPHAVCLSTDFKRAIYAGMVDIDELDPYVLIYRRLESHLILRDETERLEIVRRCLYYKAGKKLSRRAEHGTKSWQRRLMERLTDEWGWDEEKIAMLDSRADWGIRDVALERNELVRELNYSYRFLSEFAREREADALIDASEFSMLGRRLMAAHERKAGKIEILNPGRQIKVTESELSICAMADGARDGADVRWGAYAELVPPSGIAEGKPLLQAGSLTELVAWCVLNGVIGDQTHIATREQIDGLRPAEIEAMVREIREHVLPATESGTIGDEAFAEDARPVKLLMFVNVGIDPLSGAYRSGVHRVTSQTDSFGYSALRENLVRNIESLVCNSWGEIVVTRYSQESGLVRCLREYQPLPPPASEPHQLTPPLVRCFSASRAHQIRQRIEELFEDLGTRLRDEGRTATALRYVLAMENRLHVIPRRQRDTAARVAANLNELYEILGEAQPAWSPLAIDRQTLRDTPVPLIARLAQPDRVNVFCETRRDALAITIVDENGSWFHSEHASTREQSLLATIDKFLTSVRFRQGTTRLTLAVPRYFRLVREQVRTEYTATRMQPPVDIRTLRFVNVQAIAETGEHDALRYTVWCDGQPFSQAALGGAFHETIAQHITDLRRAREPYPAYITDLDLSALQAGASAPLQTTHYLRHKQGLESEINRALLRVSGQGAAPL